MELKEVVEFILYWFFSWKNIEVGLMSGWISLIFFFIKSIYYHLWTLLPIDIIKLFKPLKTP